MVSVGESGVSKEVDGKDCGEVVGVGRDKVGTVRVGLVGVGGAMGAVVVSVVAEPIGFRAGLVLATGAVFFVVEVFFGEGEAGFGLCSDTTATGRCVDAVATAGGCCTVGVSRTVCTVNVFLVRLLVQTWFRNNKRTHRVCTDSTDHTICLALVNERNQVIIRDCLRNNILSNFWIILANFRSKFWGQYRQKYIGPKIWIENWLKRTENSTEI